MSSKDEGNKDPMVIVLDGSKADDLQAKLALDTVEQELVRRGVPFSKHVLRYMEVAPCIGCFKCWVKTPGECGIKDQGLEVLKDLAKVSLLVLVTPVTFGGYSSDLKKGLDRLIPVLLPDFKKYEGETHHPHRYGDGWDLLAFGTMKANDEEKRRLFQEVVGRNSRNMHSMRVASCLLDNGKGTEGAREEVLAAIGKVMA